jgi:hypothetical protein
MDTEDRTVIAAVPFDAPKPELTPEDQTNPTADVRILESGTWPAQPVVPALPARVAAPTGMAALVAAHDKTFLPPNLWPQLRAHVNRPRSIRTWQLVLLLGAATAFGAWLSS